MSAGYYTLNEIDSSGGRFTWIDEGETANPRHWEPASPELEQHFLQLQREAGTLPRKELERRETIIALRGNARRAEALERPNRVR